MTCQKCGGFEFAEHRHADIGCPPSRCVECGWGRQYVTHDYNRCVVGGYLYHPFIQAGPASLASVVSPITARREEAK